MSNHSNNGDRDGARLDLKVEPTDNNSLDSTYSDEEVPGPEDVPLADQQGRNHAEPIKDELGREEDESPELKDGTSLLSSVDTLAHKLEQLSEASSS